MGTGGYYAYFYNCKYYGSESNFDSYPCGLGSSLVRQIPTDPEKFKEWVSSKRRELKAYKKNIHGPYEIADAARRNFLWVNWVYIIDLDILRFVVDNKASFRLDAIPRGDDGHEWIQYLQRDGSGDRCLHPSTPKDFVFIYRRCIDEVLPDPEDMERIYHSSDVRVVDPERWYGVSKNRPVLEELSFFAFKAAVEDSYGAISLSCSYRPNGATFQVPAKFLLTLLAPGILHIDHTFIQRYIYGKPDVPVLFEMRRTYPKDLPLCWWFRNCLVVFASSLNEVEHLPAWIGYAIQTVQNHKPPDPESTVILWSIQHALIVKISDTDVEHTPVFPVLDAFGHDDAMFTKGVDLLMQCLQPSCINLHTAAQHSEKIVNKDESSKPTLPFDIVSRVLDFANTETYNTFSTVSKVYRANWAKHPRVGRYKLFQADVRPTSSKGKAYPHTVGAIDCTNIDMIHPKRMFLCTVGYPSMFDERTDTESTGPADSTHTLEERSEAGAIIVHLPFYDPDYLRSQYYSYNFVPASISGLGPRCDYIFYEDDFDEYPKSVAFSSGEYETCRTEGIRWPIEIL